MNKAIVYFSMSGNNEYLAHKFYDSTVKKLIVKSMKSSQRQISSDLDFFGSWWTQFLVGE